jgi:hypothetical protein
MSKIEREGFVAACARLLQASGGMPKNFECCLESGNEVGIYGRAASHGEWIASVFSLSEPLDEISFYPELYETAVEDECRRQLLARRSLN